MLEVAIERRLKTEVEKRGGLCLKWESGWPGAPDRIVIWEGGIVHFIETKAPGKDLRPLQVKRKEMLEYLGCVFYRIRTIEEVLEYVKEKRL